ncbi:cell division protein ZapD [Shewanella sp. VB17]|uniref:cell division protein ZapD n=1 Tax=Shewanella sp. VB17 TaxID=2739432 RepID=UPI0015679C25|nr:cell division protein ZapD [Shewanella sp. VB17]NRD75538.1 cell division protein ZapD [Shewanella sp. VB17]
MTELIYEQPLNEKTRNFLRLDYLSQQLQTNVEQDHQHRCFYPLFSLCELTERCDYRGEVLQDLEKQIAILFHWQTLPHIDKQQIDAYLTRLITAKEQLQACERPGAKLKQDRFLTALRQRFNMPGACCNFDLPQLHYWLAKPWHIRQQEYLLWVDDLNTLLTPIKILLELTRQATQYYDTIAQAGFFQGNSNQALSMVRVKIDSGQGCYPTISGHKNRFAIHFVQFEQQKHSDQTIQFQLATCT